MSVQCKVCEKYYEFIPSHIRKHKLTVVKYKEMFPKTELTSIELRRRNSKAHKGRIAWNKGLTKEDSRVAKYWETRRKHFPNNEPNKRAVKTKRRKYGYSCVSNPEERTKKIRIASKKCSKKRWQTRRQRYGLSGYKISREERSRRISAGSRRLSAWNKGKTSKDDLRVNNWRNLSQKEREERLLKIALGNRRSPNSLEKRVGRIIKEFNLLFEFTGDKPYVGLGGWSPDFVSTDNCKNIIEIYGDYWHNLLEVKERDFRRIHDYQKQGYSCLVLWESEVKLSTDEEIVERIKFFTKKY